MSEGYKHRGKRPQNIARAINYHFFSRRGIKVPKLTVDEDYVMDYQERKDRIRDIFPITGIDDKKDASDTSDPKQHPFIKVISQWVINIGTRGDAQMSDLTLQETQNIYDTVTLLDARQTEVILPQSFDVTNITREAIQDINKRAGENTIKYTPYSSAEHLKTILIRELPEGMRRIVITETGSSEDINTLLKKSTALFQGERLLNIELPPNYEKMDDENKTVHQARIFMVAILARLLEKDKTPWVETLLKDMLREHLNASAKELNTYIKKLGEMENITDIDTVKKNIQYFLGNVVRLVEILEKEFRLMERFWTSA